MEPLRWGILGAAKFAREHMGPAIHASRWNTLVALATSDAAKAEPFEAFAGPLTVHTDYEALLADPQVDAIYIPLPNHMHVEWSIKALEAGKHVLCEKPLALQAGDFDALIAARDASGCHASEAFMITHHPQMHRAREIVQSGEIGRLRHVESVFTYYHAPEAPNFRKDPEKGGGGLRDIGVYTIGSTRFVTGAEAQAVPFAELELENGVDVLARFQMEFGDFALSSRVSMRMHPRQEAVFHGDKGYLRMTCPFNPAGFDQAELIVDTGGLARRVERFPSVNQYVFQVESFARTVREGADWPCPLEFSKGTQAAMDMVFAAGKDRA